MAEEINFNAEEATESEMAASHSAISGNGSRETAPDEMAAFETTLAESVPIGKMRTEIATGETLTSPTARGENKRVDRPFRVKLRGSVLVLVRLPNKRDVRAAFHQLSITGGVIHLEKPLDEKLSVELIFHIGGATIREKAQMLFPMWATQGWMQPFRFVDMTDANRESLDGHLKAFLGQSATGAAAGA
jgi:hypothetical protein